MSEAIDRYAAYAAPIATPIAIKGVSARPAARPAPRQVQVLHMFKYFRPDFTGDGLYLEKLIPLLERQGVRNDVAAEMTRPATSGSIARLFGHGRLGSFNWRLLVWFVLNAWRYDVVHLHTAIDRHFIYHLIARAVGCRVVQSCTLDDSLGNLVRGYRPRFQGIVRRLCGLIDDVIAISPALYRDSVGATPAGRVHLIPQGVTIPVVDAGLRHAARQTFGFGEDATVALFVGGMCARKDVRFLVDNHPAELGALHLLLVGPTLEAGYVEALRTAIAASPAAGRIHLAGYMENPAAAYRAADLFVFASHKEGCPNVVLEAMAFGLPVISRHLPDTTDAVIEHGSTGLLFRDGAEYRSAIRRLAGDAGARAAMGRAARAAVVASYDLNAIAARYAALYAKAAPSGLAGG